MTISKQKHFVEAMAKKISCIIKDDKQRRRTNINITKEHGQPSAKLKNITQILRLIELPNKTPFTFAL